MSTAPLDAQLDEQGSRLTVVGEIDEAAAAALRETIRTASHDFAQVLTIDLTGVTYLPSTAVGVLATSLQASRTHGHDLELVAAKGTIAQRVLEICALPHQSG